MNGDKRIFEGLEISKETALCGEHMGKYPVISISLKGMDALTYETAFQMAVQIVIEAAEKFYFLLDSEKLKEHDKAEYRKLLDDHMNEGMACSSLKFAVLTGCMRISKESIFTGLNHLKIRSITDKRFDRYFGFTDSEVKALLEYYGYPDSYDAAKKWYDGYHFGNVDIYCPWDVLNYCDSLFDDREAQPENYWINTSGNDAVKQFIRESSNVLAKREIECLVAGETVTKGNPSVFGIRL